MHKNTLARQARRAYDQDTLRDICTLPERDFGDAYGMQTVQVESYCGYRDYRKMLPLHRKSPEDYYHYRDNGASVLAVAHLDTVVPAKGRTPSFHDTSRGPLINSGALDDRLGAYVILDMLPRLGVACDWLLTVGEESGASTAGHFTHGKDYDWIIEFDRSGTDVVMYQYEDEPCTRAVEACGATMGQGSFSDIAFLEQVGVKAFNWGVGYRGNYHSEAGYAFLNDTFAMVGKYLRFHGQNAGTAMPHEKDSREYDRGDDDFPCVFCDGTMDTVTWYCTECYACADCGDDVDDCMCYAPSRTISTS